MYTITAVNERKTRSLYLHSTLVVADLHIWHLTLYRVCEHWRDEFVALQ